MTAGNFKNIRIPEPTVITIGNFDGVHTGHRLLIEKIKQYACEMELKSAILTFSPHPREFLEHTDFRLITTGNEKELIFDKLGIDYKIFIDFDSELSSLTPAEFVEAVLVCGLNCRRVVIGENYRFGKNRSGDVFELKKLCAEKGIGVDICESVLEGGQTVSSARIRGMLADGDIDGANRLLGNPYFIYGEIVRGKTIGRTLGFPTINQEVAHNKLLPKFGVYFTETLINGRCYNGITNVGIKPTVGGADKSVETFLFDFDGDVYGNMAFVKFLHRQRDEIKFDGIESLRDAIFSDKQKAVEFFGSTGNSDAY